MSLSQYSQCHILHYIFLMMILLYKDTSIRTMYYLTMETVWKNKVIKLKLSSCLLPYLTKYLNTEHNTMGQRSCFFFNSFIEITVVNKIIQVLNVQFVYFNVIFFYSRNISETGKAMKCELVYAVLIKVGIMSIGISIFFDVLEVLTP